MKRFPIQDTYALVDDEDYDLLKSLGWFWNIRNGYAITRVIENGTRKQHSMHRFLFRENNPDVIIDHIDRNRLNNTKANLRRLTPTENANNRVDNVRVEAFGETDTLANLARKYGIDYDLFRRRLRRGIFVELALLAKEGELESFG